MNELEEKCLRFVLRHFQKNKLDTRQALKVFKEKHGVVGRAGGKNRYFLTLSGLAAAILLAFIVWVGISPEKQWTELAAYEHAVKYQLPDSSVVTVYPYSSICFRTKDYAKVCREVKLTGKADFRIKRDCTRPFKVIGKLAEVQVLGTCFVMDESRADTAWVQVESGKVRFSVLGQSEGVELLAGMEAQVVKGQHVPQIVHRPDSVKKGSFVFENTPLPKVLTELSHYYGVKLVADRTDKRLTANFDAHSLDEIIEIIEKVLKVHIKKQV